MNESFIAVRTFSKVLANVIELFNVVFCILKCTGPLKKLFHYAIFQKFFHIYIIHLWSMFTIHVI